MNGSEEMENTEGNMAFSAESRQGGIQVIARSGAILRALAANPQGISLATIANHVKLPRSTVQRIVNALETENLVEPLGPAGGFKLGPAFGQLVRMTQVDIVSETHPHLTVLSEQLQETAALASASNNMVNVIDTIVAERVLRVVLPLGTAAPLHTTAAGRVLLASMSPEEQADALSLPVPKYTSQTLNVPELRKELQKIASQGYAFEQDEYINGMSSIAILLETYMGNFSISLTMPTSRFPQHKEPILEAMQTVRARIELRIGKEHQRNKKTV